MAKYMEIYKCEICGNIVEDVHGGAGQLVCCNQPMTLMNAKTEDEGREKHLPVAERNENGVLVKVGSVEHPMEEKHYIEWVEIIFEDRVVRKTFLPGEKPEVQFCSKAKDITVRAYCNIHGLWSTKI